MGRSPRAGFSLIELMATVAVAGILCALAVAGLEPMRRGLESSRAVEDVHAAVFRARMLARQTGRCVRLDVLAGASSVSPGIPGDTLRLMRRRSADCESAFSSADADPVSTLAMPNGIALTDLSAIPVEWRPNGRLAGSAGAFLIEGAGRRGFVLAAAQGPVCAAQSATEACP